MLAKGGRLIVFESTKELKGTPAAPEPIASQLHFYEDEQLVQLAHQGGFEEARVERISFEEYDVKPRFLKKQRVYFPPMPETVSFF